MEIFEHYRICLEWEDCTSKHSYPFKFNQDWLLDEDFSQIVENSWKEIVPFSVDDYMRGLVYKLKRLKGVVKGWEKSQLEKICKDLLTIETKIRALFDSCPSGIFLVEKDSILLASLKCKIMKKN